MINFSTLQGLTIPEGVVTQITDASGRVLWAAQSGKPIVLQVEKITSDTFAGETAYTGEQFILLDIYPKTNGTVKVTYGGLTKTITDTSGAEEPNAQQVFFGTFNGVSDSVATPASGELTIEGDCVAFSCGAFKHSSKINALPGKFIVAVTGWGGVEYIPALAFYGNDLTSVTIPESITCIESFAFNRCLYLTSVVFENTSGWYVTNTEGATSGTAVDVSNPANNAAMLTNLSDAETNQGYCDYYWYRS